MRKIGTISQKILIFINNIYDDITMLLEKRNFFQKYMKYAVKIEIICP